MLGPFGTQLSFFSVQLLLSAFLSITLGFYFLRTRVGLKAEFFLILLAALWSICYSYEIMSTGLASKLFWAKMQFFGKATVGLGYLYFLKNNYNKGWLRRPVLVFCTLMSAITLVLAFSNEHHGLMWSYVSIDESLAIAPLRFGYGPWHWVFLAYNFVLIMGIAIVTYRMLIGSKQVYRGKVMLLSLCFVAPFFASVIHHLNISPVHLDFSPLLLNISTVVIAATSPFSKYNKEIFNLARSLIFDRMNDAVIMLDEESRVLDLNTVAKNLMGASDVYGKPMSEILPSFRADWDDLWVRYWHTGLGRSEVVLENRVYELSASPILDWRGQIYSQILVLQDISERKKLEDSLRSYSEHLEELVEERTRKLRDAERLAAIGELSAMIGHDLRNPLTGIAGAVYYLKNNLDIGGDNQNLKMIELIEMNIQYSDKIISDLLDYSRNITLDIAKITPAQLVEESLSVVNVPDNVELFVDVLDSVSIWVDIQKMKRVFSNIINNAFEAMPDGGRLTIESTERGENIELSFSDTGKGIPEDVVKKIGSPLFTTKAKGMGLGIAICQRFVRAHNGTIDVSSDVGEGTTFKLTIPIDYSPEEPVEEVPDTVASIEAENQ